jgi:hypothetical protein
MVYDGEVKLRKMMRAYGVASVSEDVLISMLDPFHDEKLHLKGLPDMKTSLSITPCLTKTQVVNFAGEGEWDAAVFVTPFLTTDTDATNHSPHVAGDERMMPTACYEIYNAPASNDDLTTKYVFDENHDAAGVQDTTFATVMIHSADAGEDLFPPRALATAYDSWAPTNFTSLGIHSLVAGNTNVRLVSLGFEIHDTTAEVYKQGTITATQYANHYALAHGGISSVNAPANTKTKGLELYTRPEDGPRMFMRGFVPYPLEDAITMPDSRQWEARHGAYAVAHMLNNNNDPFVGGIHRAIPVLSQVLTADNSATAASESSALVYSKLDATYGWIPGATSVNMHNHSMPCIYLSGLNPVSTFTVTVKSYVEYFVVPSSTFMPMAEPSTPYDPRALEFYSIVSARLPCAVMVGANAAGDWWKIIYGVARNAIPRVMDYFLPGTGVAVTGAIEAGESIYKTVRGLRRAKRANQELAWEKYVDHNPSIPAPGEQWTTGMMPKGTTYVPVTFVDGKPRPISRKAIRAAEKEAKGKRGKVRGKGLVGNYTPK